MQYLRHKEESRIPCGLMLFRPEAVRSTGATEREVHEAVRQHVPTVLIDAGPVKGEMRDRPFLAVIDFLITEVLPRLATRQHCNFPLARVISLLQQRATEMIQEIAPEETSILSIITNRDLLSTLGRLKPNQVEDVARFLASYILMSQTLFLRLLFSARPGHFLGPLSPVTHHRLRGAFGARCRHEIQCEVSQL